MRRLDSRKLAGVLLLLAGALILMGIITAETQYPADRGYSTARNEISDLGTTNPANSAITHPAAYVFNTTMVVSGAMTVVAALSLQRRHRRRAAPYLIAAYGLSIMAVGLFPSDKELAHSVAALGAFVFGGVSAIAAARVSTGPFRIISVGLGVTALFFLAIGREFASFLGIGGVERWVAYPNVVWMIAFGGYVLAGNTDQAMGRTTHPSL